MDPRDNAPYPFGIPVSGPPPQRSAIHTRSGKPIAEDRGDAASWFIGLSLGRGHVIEDGVSVDFLGLVREQFRTDMREATLAVYR